MGADRHIALIQGHSQGRLTVSTSEATTDVIDAGIYDVWSDVESYLKIGLNPSGVTTSNGYVLFAGVAVTFEIDAGQSINAIALGGGTLSYHRVG